MVGVHLQRLPKGLLGLGRLARRIGDHAVVVVQFRAVRARLQAESVLFFGLVCLRLRSVQDHEVDPGLQQ